MNTWGIFFWAAQSFLWGQKELSFKGRGNSSMKKSIPRQSCGQLVTENHVECMILHTLSIEVSWSIKKLVTFTTNVNLFGHWKLCHYLPWGSNKP
jgi:hypothetical protein